jgi:hypothetical protein
MGTSRTVEQIWNTFAVAFQVFAVILTPELVEGEGSAPSTWP